MTLHIFSFFTELLDFLFSGLSWLLDLFWGAVGFLGRCLGAVLNVLGSLLSGAARALSLPVRWGGELLDRLTEAPLFWTPVLTLAGLALVLFVLILTGWAISARNTGKR